MKTLVLGYGNRSRTDDGVGWFVLERLEELGLPNVELHTSHQLDVDHAEAAKSFETALAIESRQGAEHYGERGGGTFDRP